MLGDSIINSFVGGSDPSKKDNAPESYNILGSCIQDAKFMAMMRMLQAEQNEYMEKRELQKEQVAWAKDVIASGRGRDQGEVKLEF